MQTSHIRLPHPVKKVHRGVLANLRRMTDSGTTSASQADLPAAEGSASTVDAKRTVDPHQQLAAAIQTLADQCSAWNSAMQAQLAQLQDLAVEIGFMVAQRLIHSEVQAARHDVVALVQAALAAAGPRAAAVVWLSVTDAQRLETAWPAANRGNAAESITIQVDNGLEDGNLRLELPGFELVFDWRHELEALRQQILNVGTYAAA